MNTVSLSWVNELLKELQSQSKTPLDIAENLSSPADVLSWAMPPNIWIYEVDEEKSRIFSFVTDTKPFKFECHVEKYPSLLDLIKKYCPEDKYTIIDPWEKERQKQEKINLLEIELEEQKKIHNDAAARWNEIIDQINEIKRS